VQASSSSSSSSEDSLLTTTTTTSSLSSSSSSSTSDETLATTLLLSSLSDTIVAQGKNLSAPKKYKELSVTTIGLTPTDFTPSGKFMRYILLCTIYPIYSYVGYDDDDNDADGDKYDGYDVLYEYDDNE
jgi:hypothetical protein